MMQYEFEGRIHQEIDPDIYEDIEYVYNYHPAQMSKDDAAALYTMFGPAIFESMREEADKVFNIEEEIRVLQEKIHQIELEIESLKTEKRQLREDWNSSYALTQKKGGENDQIKM